MTILDLDPMARPVTFRVAGLPAPKGSLRAFIPKGWSRPVLTSMAKGLKPWAAEVRRCATYAGGSVLDGAVRVELSFILHRPQRLSAKKPTPAHLTTPDLDKLSRGVLDSLTGVLFKDDSQVTRLDCAKRYARPDEAPGVLVTVRRAGADMHEGLQA